MNMDVTETKKWVVDTNILLDHVDSTALDGTVVLMSTVKQELDKLKTVDNEELKYKARRANRFIFENFNKFTHDVTEYNSEEILGAYFSNEIKDNRIVSCAKANGYGVITNDLNLFSTAKSFGLEVDSVREDGRKTEHDYKGYKEVYMTEEEHQDFYTNKLGENVYELLINEYLIVIDDVTGEAIDALKWNGKYHTTIDSKISIRSQKVGDFKPYDLYQSCAIDAVRENQLVMLRGKAGVAKTQIAIAYALQELQSGRNYSKIIVFSNSLPAKGAFYHGLVRGDLQTKLLDSSIGNILSSKLGSRSAVEAMLMTEELMILPASDIRGFDSSGTNSILILSESQNWSRPLMKLAIQRLGSDCKMIIEGDNTTQLDSKEYEGYNNGMTAASEVFRGQEYYGEVELKNIYRSEIAARAELMTQEV